MLAVHEDGQNGRAGRQVAWTHRMRSAGIALTLVTVVSSAVGCGGAPRTRMGGRLVYADGVGVSVLDLDTGTRRVVFGRNGARTTCAEGISGLGDDAVLVSCAFWGTWTSRTLRVELATGDTASFGPSRFVTAVTDSGPFVWYHGRAGVRDSACALFMASRLEAGPSRWVSKGPVGAPVWAYLVGAPVIMDSARVAFVGESLDVRVLEVATGRYRTIGHSGEIPMMWLPGPRRLLCRQRWNGGKVVEFAPEEPMGTPVPELDDACGWAVVGRGDSVLFCRGSTRFPMTEIYDVFLLDRNTRQVSLVAPGVLLYRQSAYLRQ